MLTLNMFAILYAHVYISEEAKRMRILMRSATNTFSDR